MAINMDELLRAFGRPMNPNTIPVQDMRIQSIPAQPAQPAQAAPAPIYARNPQTGARIMSTDGGQNWSPVR
jgi:hypothetical protein